MINILKLASVILSHWNNISEPLPVRPGPHSENPSALLQVNTLRHIIIIMYVRHDPNPNSWAYSLILSLV